MPVRIYAVPHIYPTIQLTDAIVQFRRLRLITRNKGRYIHVDTIDRTLNIEPQKQKDAVRCIYIQVIESARRGPLNELNTRSRPNPRPSARTDPMRRIQRVFCFEEENAIDTILLHSRDKPCVDIWKSDRR